MSFKPQRASEAIPTLSCPGVRRCEYGFKPQRASEAIPTGHPFLHCELVHSSFKPQRASEAIPTTKVVVGWVVMLNVSNPNGLQRPSQPGFLDQRPFIVSFVSNPNGLQRPSQPRC